MKKLIFVIVFAFGLTMLTSCEADNQENDNLAVEIKKMDNQATGKDGGSSTGDKDGDG
ncbi:hypothetical protein [Muricauda sp. MAR_2010_75]|uniref:hypothetical protein n=1 Tax=Allomuricauda sp. MAR_2010_75 TaxID=1250232 RepID=UPI0012E03D57|nr:hypothetical protein [Muricauda sp. MAR_2010_75]